MLLKKVDDLTLKDINFSYKKNFSSQKILDKGFNFKYENIESAIKDLVKKIDP